jgi:hypothetical protein
MRRAQQAAATVRGQRCARSAHRVFNQIGAFPAIAAGAYENPKLPRMVLAQHESGTINPVLMFTLTFSQRLDVQQT